MEGIFYQGKCPVFVLVYRGKSDPYMLNNFGSRFSDQPRLLTGSSGEIWKGLRLICSKSKQMTLHDCLDWNISVFPQLNRGQWLQNYCSFVSSAPDPSFCLLSQGILGLLSFVCSFLPPFVYNFILSQNKRVKIIPCSIHSLSGNLAYKWEDEMWPNKRIYFYFNLFPCGLFCLLSLWPNQFYLYTNFFFKVKKHFGIIIIGE